MVRGKYPRSCYRRDQSDATNRCLTAGRRTSQLLDKSGLVVSSHSLRTSGPTPRRRPTTRRRTVSAFLGRKGKNSKSRSSHRHPVQCSIFELGTTSSAGIHIDLHSNRHFDNL